MPVRSCKGTIHVPLGTEHTVNVTAGSLYEAVALGLATIRDDEWVAGIPDGLNEVKVSPSNVAIERPVKIQDFKTWLDRPNRSPLELIAREKVLGILGLQSKP